jgi:hypothetical protein
MRIINVDAITSIVITDKQKSFRYVWLPYLPERKIFFGLIKLEDAYSQGFYEKGERKRNPWSDAGGLVNLQEIIESNHFIDHNVVWKKPRLEIRFDNGDTLVKYFDQVNECDEYAHYLQSQSRNTFEIIEAL